MTLDEVDDWIKSESMSSSTHGQESESGESQIYEILKFMEIFLRFHLLYIKLLLIRSFVASNFAVNL